MSFPAFLKNSLTALVEIYDEYFSKTFSIALLWTIICFAIALLLAAYTDYDPKSIIHPVSIVSYFITRFSYKGTYSYVDLVKTLFIFFVSIFSVKMISGKVTIKASLYLFAILVVCVLLDCALFRFKEQLQSSINYNHQAVSWVDGILFLLRIYIPLLLFALIIQICVSNTKFTAKRIAFLLVTLWLFNEISYETTLLFRTVIVNLILIPFKPESYSYAIESILAIPLTATYFLGFYWAMTSAFTISTEEYSVA